MARGLHAKDAAMDLVVTSSLGKLTLLQSSQSFDCAQRLAENIKFTDDLRSTDPLQRSTTQRFIPLVQNQGGKPSPHIEATLREFTTLLTKRSSGCHLLQGPFAIPQTVALTKVLLCWGSRLTQTDQRELAAQVTRGVQAQKVVDAFLGTAALRGDSSIVHLPCGLG
jgi:hypothetical protein